MKIAIGTKVQIKAVCEGMLRAKGQDTRIEIVNDDGTTTPIPNVAAASWEVTGRTNYAKVRLVLHGDARMEGEVDSIEIRDGWPNSVKIALDALVMAARNVESAEIGAAEGLVTAEAINAAHDELSKARQEAELAIVHFASLGGPTSIGQAASEIAHANTLISPSEDGSHRADRSGAIQSAVQDDS